MEGVYKNMPEANQVPRTCNVAAVLCLLYMVHTSIMSLFMLNVLYLYLTVVLSVV